MNILQDGLSISYDGGDTIYINGIAHTVPIYAQGENSLSVSGDEVILNGYYIVEGEFTKKRKMKKNPNRIEYIPLQFKTKLLITFFIIIAILIAILIKS